MQIKKIFYILLSLTILFISTSCNNTAVDTISETSIQTESQTEPAIEYKTIEPPEDGWTLELLNEVTYINGKDIDLPFCLNDLGEDFTFIERASDNGVYVGMVHFKGKEAFYAVSSHARDEFDRYDVIDKFDLGLFKNLSSLDLSDFLIINGINLSSSMNDIYTNLGIDDYNSIGKRSENSDFVDNALCYIIGDSNNDIRILFDESFIETDKLKNPYNISINLRENNHE
ncbi:MAG: hypothetical protein LBM59_02225 [Ruminococcus sp.]|jgi:hypothetical protein|nr:hypothetical protein [Ruminococcus sp.]